MIRERGVALPGWLVPIFGLGAALALGGGLWDDAWHTERGRDSFFIAPHIAIYGGISLVGTGISLWLVLAARAVGLRTALRTPVIALAAASVAVTLASAPVDNLWHTAFGRDAVIWSPPHVLGIVGTGSLAVAVLVDLARSPQAWAQHAQGPVGGLLLAAFAFVVIEYETDVPQFASVWYLPVLALAAGLVFSMVARLSSRSAPAVRASLWHLLFIAASAALLVAGGFDAPRVPLLVIPAAAFDLTGRSAMKLLPRSAVLAVTLLAVYAPMSHVGHGLRLDLSDVLIGLPLAWAAFAITLGTVSGRRIGPPGGSLLPTALLLVLLLPASAPAHDPGQGADAGSIDLRIETAGGLARVTARSTDVTLEPVGIIARRAGVTRRASLRQPRPGTFSGQVRLGTAGRWFVYLDLRRPDGQVIEAWLPVEGAGADTVAEPRRFAYVVPRKPSSSVKWLVGGLLYLLVIGFLAYVVGLVRRTAGR